MITNLIAYGITALGLFLIDAIWLRLVMMPLYQQHLRHLLADTFLYWPVIVFYLLYPAGLCFFVINPALKNNTSLLAVFGSAMFLGVLAYSVYDLTNLATLRSWPVAIAMIDIAWGGTVSALAAVITVWLTRIIMVK